MHEAIDGQTKMNTKGSWSHRWLFALAVHDVIGIYLTLKAIVYNSKNQICNEVNTQQHVKNKKEAIPTRRPVKDNISQCNAYFRMLEKCLL